MTFALRPMRVSDLDAVLSIAATAPDAPHWPRPAYEAYLAPDPASPTLLRVALVAASPDAAAVIGFACSTLLLDGVQNLCQLDSVAVLPSARRHRIGTALLSELLARAAHHGARHLSLEVRASNTAAIALYRSFGLRLEGRRPRYYIHPEEDALLLGMPVTPGTP